MSGTAPARDADVIVVGAGHNGLTAACYLARAGHDVLVVEAAAAIGGMTTTQAVIPEAPEHQINLCAMDVVAIRASTVVADLELERFGYWDLEVDPPYVSLDPDGDASIAIWRDPRQTADEIRRFSAHDAVAFLDFARTLDAAMDMALPLMLTNPTRPSSRSLLAAAGGVARHPRQLGQLGSLLTASAAEAIDERFRHPMVRGPLAVMCGSGGPITAPASASLLIFFGFFHRVGIGRLAGGTQALPDSLARCLAAAGGRVRTSAPVDELTVDQGRVTGVRLANGEELTARAVVASCDPRQTLTRLLPAGTLPERATRRATHIPTGNAGAMCFKVDMAFSGRLELPRYQAWRRDGLDLRVPAALVGTFEQVCEAGDRSLAGLLPDPMPYAAAIPTAVDPSQAPNGCDTIYLYAFPAPTRPPEGWNQLQDRATKALVADAARFYTGIEQLEIGRWVETWPAMAAERTHATDGNPYHVDITLLRSGPLRPALGFGGYRTPVPGLFLTGAGTHPGPAMSGIPGQLAARTVIRTLR